MGLDKVAESLGRPVEDVVGYYVGRRLDQALLDANIRPVSGLKWNPKGKGGDKRFGNWWSSGRIGYRYGRFTEGDGMIRLEGGQKTQDRRDRYKPKLLGQTLKSNWDQGALGLPSLRGGSDLRKIVDRLIKEAKAGNDPMLPIRKRELVIVEKQLKDLMKPTFLTTLDLTSSPREKLVQFSRLKMGDRNEINYFGEELLSLIRLVLADELTEGAGWIVVTPGVIGENSSRPVSMELGKYVAEKMGLPIAHVNATFQGGSMVPYSTLTTDQRRDYLNQSQMSLSAPVNGQRVIYIDDSWVSGTLWDRHFDLLTTSGAKEVYSFVAAKLNSAGEASVEHRYNQTALTTEKLGVLAELLNDPQTAVTTRLLQYINELNDDDYSHLLPQLTPDALLRLKAEYQKFKEGSITPARLAHLTAPGAPGAIATKFNFLIAQRFGLKGVGWFEGIIIGSSFLPFIYAFSKLLSLSSIEGSHWISFMVGISFFIVGWSIVLVVLHLGFGVLGVHNKAYANLLLIAENKKNDEQHDEFVYAATFRALSSMVGLPLLILGLTLFQDALLWKILTISAGILLGGWRHGRLNNPFDFKLKKTQWQEDQERKEELNKQVL